jgi:hypothetical protein
METTYTDMRLHAGRTNDGKQKFRNISVRKTKISYELEEQTKTTTHYDEEVGVFYDRIVMTRPRMTCSTTVTCKRVMNGRMATISLYGVQG